MTSPSRSPSSNEALLLALLRHEPVPPDALEGLDGPCWLDLARRHRLAGLLREAAQDTASSRWPPGVIEALNTVHRKTLADNLVLVAALHEVSRLLSGHGVDFLVLKGASLLGFLYRDPGCRPMSDLDLLIRKDDWSRVAAVLGEQGYIMPTVEQESFYGDIWYHQLVTTPRMPSCHIEFHWNIESSERSRVPPDDLRRRAVPFELDGHTYRRLGNDDLFLHLAVHLAHHFDDPSLHWVEDIRRLLATASLDWPAIEARARRWRVRNGVAYALRYVDRIDPAAVPEAARRLRLSPGRRLLLWMLSTSDPTLAHRPLRSGLTRHAVSMALLDRWSSATVYIASHLMLRLGRRLGLARRAPGEARR
ncbi:MAG: nucleotidyltransferase family protein [Acidobacteriota bacterium]